MVSLLFPDIVPVCLLWPRWTKPASVLLYHKLVVFIFKIECCGSYNRSTNITGPVQALERELSDSLKTSESAHAVV